MKAAVLEGIDSLVLRELPKPSVDSDSMLIRVRACTICGSDVKILHNGNPRVKYPAVIGHEIAGEIVEVGKNVSGFSAGDRVAVGADVPCGSCDYCKNGMGNCCDLNYAIGYQFPGGFAEYCLLNGTTVKYGPIAKMPAKMTYEEGALAEQLGCVLNGLELAQMKEGKSVLVLGAGPVGCLISNAASAMGASRIIVSDPNQNRRESAKKFGADILANPADLVQTAKAATNNKGCDIVMVAVPSLEAQESAIRCVAKRGFVNFFAGIPKTKSSQLSVDSNFLHYNEVFLFGSHGCVPRHHKAAVDMIASGKINTKDLITHSFPLDKIKEAFSFVASLEGLKVVINP